MHVLIAPGSYKSTVKSIEATETLASAVHEVLPGASVEKLVLADGGEGTLETFSWHFGHVTESHSVQDPFGNNILANLSFGPDDTALIESCQAIGFSLVEPDRMNPFRASTSGVGELIAHAVRRGARRVLIGMGDSATMDMGVGMLHALGVKFYSPRGEVVNPGLHNLHQIADFDDSALDHLRDRVTFVGLVDTNDYLCGEVGQVQLYGRQKGLSASDIPVVESAFLRFAETIHRRIGVDVTKVIRSTGSGGLAAALHSFFNAELLNTLDYLSTRLQFDSLLRRADITITGEGCLDNQTRLGKVPYFVAARSTRRCIAIVGTYTHEGLTDMQGVCSRASLFCLNPRSAMSNPRAALREAASAIASLMG